MENERRRSNFIIKENNAIILAEIIGEDIDVTSDSNNETTMKMNSKYCKPSP